MEVGQRVEAKHDPLTGIYDQHMLRDKPGRILRSSARYERSGAVRMPAIDNFRWTNHSYGHAAGH